MNIQKCLYCCHFPSVLNAKTQRMSTVNLYQTRNNAAPNSSHNLLCLLSWEMFCLIISVKSSCPGSSYLSICNLPISSEWGKKIVFQVDKNILSWAENLSYYENWIQYLAQDYLLKLSAWGRCCFLLSFLDLMQWNLPRNQPGMNMWEMYALNETLLNETMCPVSVLVFKEEKVYVGAKGEREWISAYESTVHRGLVYSFPLHNPDLWAGWEGVGGTGGRFAPNQERQIGVKMSQSSLANIRLENPLPQHLRLPSNQYKSSASARPDLPGKILRKQKAAMAKTRH